MMENSAGKILPNTNLVMKIVEIVPRQSMLFMYSKKTKVSWNDVVDSINSSIQLIYVYVFMCKLTAKCRILKTCANRSLSHTHNKVKYTRKTASNQLH